MPHPALRAALLAFIPWLAACAADLADQDYRVGHPAAVEQRSLQARFDRLEEGQRLPDIDRERLARLAGEWLRRGAGPVAIAGGDGGLAQDLAGILRELGVVVAVLPEGAKAETAVVEVPVWAVRLPECGAFERGFNPDMDNMPHSNWGCALQRNRAAMVQNPADLVRARPASGRDGSRAADVLDKYQRGAATGSAEEGISAGTASSVGH